MLGVLHSEMVIIKMIGDRLEGSGWAEVINDAGITTPGRAEALYSPQRISTVLATHIRLYLWWS